MTKKGINWNYHLEGEGEPLLFLHGWGVDSRIWRQQTKYFSHQYKVLAIDLPGHGKSTWRQVSLKEMAEGINLVLEKLELTEVNVIGSSLGGMVVLKLFELFPQRFKRITFVGVLPKFAGCDDFPFGWHKSLIHRFASHVDEDYPEIVNVFFRSLFTVKERESRRFKWLQIFRRNIEFPEKQALKNYLDILEKEDLRGVLKTIDIPLQLINGRDDQICPPDVVKFFKKEVPHARVDFFEHCGHFPFLTKPHEFNRVVEEFLKT